MVDTHWGLERKQHGAGSESWKEKVDEEEEEGSVLRRVFLLTVPTIQRASFVLSTLQQCGGVSGARKVGSLCLNNEELFLHRTGETVMVCILCIQGACALLPVFFCSHTP